MDRILRLVGWVHAPYETVTVTLKNEKGEYNFINRFANQIFRDCSELNRIMILPIESSIQERMFNSGCSQKGLSKKFNK